MLKKGNIILVIYFLIIICQELVPNVSIVFQIINVMYGLFLFLVIGLNRIKFNSFKNKEIINILIKTFLLFLLCGTVSFLYNRNNGIFLIFKMLTHLEISFIIVDKDVSYKMYNKLYYITIVCILIKWIVVKNENLVFNSSRNAISVFLLFLCCIDMYLRQRNGFTVDYKKVLITMILSLLAKGRSGIIISVLFLFFVVCYNIFSKNHKSKFKTVIFILGCCIILVYSINFINTYLESFNRWGMESERGEFWKDYISNLDNSFFNIVFGVKLHDISMLKVFDYNLHNSFLMLHANYGVIPTIYVIWVLSYGFILSIKNKNFEMFLFIFILVLKGNIDYVIFHSYCDVLFFMIYLNIIKDYKSRRTFNAKENNEFIN